MRPGEDRSTVRPPTEAERRVTTPFRVRFDESRPDGTIRPSSLLRYASELAWIHSEARGFGREWYHARDLAWLVRGVDLRIQGPIRDGETIVGETEPIATRKVLARRRTTFTAADGQVVSELLVDWALTSGAGVPIRIPPVFAIAFGTSAATFDPIRVRPELPAGTRPTTVDLVVRPQELDPMGHVNNAVYLEWAEEAIAAAGEPGARALAAVPRRYRLEYRAAASPGSAIRVEAWPDEIGWSCRAAQAGTGDPILGARSDRRPPAEPR